MKLHQTIALLIPAFNASVYLPRLLKSAKRQTEPFDEIWVYDDCSTDNTVAIAQQYDARVVSGAINRGCSHGKNALAALTTADWVHFHDADDELLPNFVSLARKWVNDNRFDVILFPFEERDEDTGTHIAYNRFDPSEAVRDPRSYAIRRQINAICGLYRRSAFLEAGGYDEDPLVLYNEDVAMHIQLAFAGLSFAAETEISIINHRRLNSMSASNRLKCLLAHYHVMRKTIQRDGAHQYAAQIADRLWNAVGGLAAQLDWVTADAATRLAIDIAGLSTLPRGTIFQSMCRISPFAAIRFREFIIRGVKPQNRKGYPGWRSPVGLL